MSEPAPPSDARAVAERTFHDEYGRVLATLIRLLGGDFDAAEEATADAFVAALETWPRDGVPANPGAWLTTAARNRALDRIRRARRQAAHLAAVEHDLASGSLETTVRIGTDTRLADDRLRLVFTCCHPALPLEARVALTLRTLGGLTTPEIARAFLVPEATMAQRLVRAKRKIRDAGIPYRVPPDELLPERLDGVLATLYLVFNEGYAASGGDRLVRGELCAEAIRLARLVAELMPGEGEAHGLLALMLLQDSRRNARLDADGAIVLLGDQDRGRWDRAEIDEGLALVGRAWSLVMAGAPASSEGPAGPYLLQATIAAEHARTVSGGATDWGAIAGLYAALAAIQPTPIVELNRAVAVAHAGGPGDALAILDRLAAGHALDDYHLFHAARADMLHRLARLDDAAAAYRRAIACAGTGPELTLLQRRLAELELERGRRDGAP